MQAQAEQLYDSASVQKLFNEMSATYGWVNLLSSFGFTWWWRRQCIRLAKLPRDARVGDFMSGQGETWHQIHLAIGDQGHIVAFDFSAGMASLSTKNPVASKHAVHISQQNALSTALASHSLDAVVAGFGLKTLSESQLHALAHEVRRVLKPGGTFSLVEISTPTSKVLLWPYMFYLRVCIPVIGKLCLGNPDNYRFLAQYTQLFKNARRAQAAFQAAGLHTDYTELFFGCASAIYGHTNPRSNHGKHMATN